MITKQPTIIPVAKFQELFLQSLKRTARATYPSLGRGFGIPTSITNGRYENGTGTLSHLTQYGYFQKYGKPSKSSILIGFSIIFTIHFGVPQFLETPILRVSLFSELVPFYP